MPKGFASLDDIVSNGFCIGCGLCAAVAPAARIEMRLAGHGHLRPVAQAAITEEDQARIVRHCPGVTVKGPFADQTDAPLDDVWGANRRVTRGYATDRALRFRASSGGVMTAINRFLLRTARVAFVLQTRPDPNDPFGTVSSICRDADALMTAGGSRYGTGATLRDFSAVLDLGEPFAVSMKPCDIAGLRNLQREDPRARDLIRFTQAMFCGTVPSFSSTAGFFARRGIDLATNRPLSFRWRGEGCPGPTVAEMPDGRVLVGTYNELWNENPWTTQFRCKVCPDAVGLQADVAVGDDWPGAAPVGEDEGWNALIAHTPLGLEVLNACEAAGDLALWDRDPRYLDEVQPHHVRLRQGLSSRLDACAEVGIPEPAFTDLALDACAAALLAEDRQRTFEGTVARLRKGHGDEDAVADFGAAMGNMLRME
jgi:coenzyme F420 hydrogenase subunit beta